MTDLHEIAVESRYVPGQPMNVKKTTLIVESFIDPSAILGPRSVAWHYSRILAKVVIGADCSIGGGSEIGADTSIGDRSRIGANVFLPPRTTIGADVFIGPNVTCTDDKHPRCGNADYLAEPPTIEDHVSIGAGAVILPGIRIGHHAKVGAGAIVTRDVPAHGFVRCEPARAARPSTAALGWIHA